MGLDISVCLRRRKSRGRPLDANLFFWCSRGGVMDRAVLDSGVMGARREPMLLTEPKIDAVIASLRGEIAAVHEEMREECGGDKDDPAVGYYRDQLDEIAKCVSEWKVIRTICGNLSESSSDCALFMIYSD